MLKRLTFIFLVGLLSCGGSPGNITFFLDISGWNATELDAYVAEFRDYIVRNGGDCRAEPRNGRLMECWGLHNLEVGEDGESYSGQVSIEISDRTWSSTSDVLEVWGDASAVFAWDYLRMIEPHINFVKITQPFIEGQKILGLEIYQDDGSRTIKNYQQYWE